MLKKLSQKKVSEHREIAERAARWDCPRICKWECYNDPDFLEYALAYIMYQ